MTPEVVVYTENGWWMRWREDRLGWLWVRIDSQSGAEARRFTELPTVVETYRSVATLTALARGDSA